MAANINNGLALVQQYLIQHATVSALIADGTAVTLSSPRDPTPQEVPMPGVVIGLQGGEGYGSSVTLLQVMVTIWCFSRDGQSQAGDLHHAVLEALQREHLRSTVTLTSGARANPTACACDFQGGITDRWHEGLGAWSRSSRWMLTIV